MKFLITIALVMGASTVQAQATRPTTHPATTKPLKGMDAPAADKLLNSMLKPMTDNSGGPIPPLPDPPRIDPATNKIIPPNPPTPTLKREGSFIFDMNGRLQKNADGSGWDIVFDSDGKLLENPPMGVIPNQKLASMELVIQGANRDPKFKVTGMVTEYKGKNYLLLEKATVVSEVTQQF